MTSLPSDLWDVLKARLTEQRQQKMLDVARQRTYRIALVIQDVHDPHNISACLRSAEAFGIQNCHIVQLRNHYRPSPVTRGVENWLSIHRHTSIEGCVDHLKSNGYKIYAAIPRPHAIALENLPLQEDPIAVVFGNEKDGIDPDWDSWLDGYFTIPMFGMVESLNISVSCAITLQYLSSRLRRELGSKINLDSRDQNHLLGRWLSQQFIETWHSEYLARKNQALK